MENKCPKCGSCNTYVDKKGFSGKNAVVGTLVAGPIGAAAGTIGSNKVKITCLDCGYSYYAGQYDKKRMEIEAKQQPIKFVTGFAIFSFIFSLFSLFIWLIFHSTFFGIQSAIWGTIFLIALIIALDNSSNSKKQRGRHDFRHGNIKHTQSSLCRNVTGVGT